MGTKNNPGKFDCYEKAERDEPMFVLLGRDPAASMAVLFWIAVRRQLRLGGDEKNEEAMTCAHALEAWARSKGKGEDVDAAFRDAASSLTEVAKREAVEKEREACAAVCEAFVLAEEPDEDEPALLRARDKILARGDAD